MKFGIAQNVRSEVRECTPELLNQALDAPHVAKTCAEIEDALEDYRQGKLTQSEFETLKSQLKKRLPILTPHATFLNRRRKNDEAVPSGLSIYDLDHIPNPRAKWAEIEARKKELGILLSHITPSTEGLRLIFVMPQGMDLAQSQAWMARELGDEKYDACVKDFARSSFLVPRDYVLYQSEALFNEELTKNEERRTMNEELPSDGEKNSSIFIPHSSFPTTYEDLDYGFIIEVLEEQMGGKPDIGSRNNFIFSMACHLRYITNDDPLWIAQILPTYGEEREKRMSTIRSACNRSQTKTMPRIMKRTLGICKKRMAEEEEIRNHQSETDSPPPLPKRLPPLIKLLVSRTPAIYQPAVAHAVFPSLATHLYDTRFRYIDNCLHEATLSCLLMAPTGSGKSSVNTPIDYIMADIRERDTVNMEKERNWKRETQSRGANKDKRQRPEGIIIQCIDADITSAAFVQRMADAEGRFLYVRMNEIDQLYNLSSRGNSHNVFDLLCLCFDFGNLYGQTRVGTGSVSEKVTVRFNYNVSTTIRKGQYFFRNVLTDGPLSRINICTIPERPIGSEMPVYGTYDETFAQELKPYIDRLNSARGLIECAQASKLTKKLVEECAEFSRLSQSRVYENLSFRANVIAFLKAMVLYVAHGEKWDKSMEDFVRWSLQYDLWCKMKFFGNAIEAQEESGMKLPTKGPQNLLDQLPEVFTRAEAGQMRQRMGIRTGSLRMMLGNWTHRGYIELYGEELPKQDLDRQCYIKTEKYLRKHPQP